MLAERRIDPNYRSFIISSDSDEDGCPNIFYFHFPSASSLLEDATSRYVLSSDIDILVVTREDPAKMHAELWKNGVKEPFEVHIQPPENAHLYLKRGKFIEIS